MDGERAALYPLLFEHNPQPIWVIDLATFAFVDANRATEELYGYPRAELLQRTILDDVSDEVRASLTAKRASVGGRPSVGVWQIRRKDGGVRWIEVRTQAIPETSRRLVVGRDVTEEHATAEALRQVRDRFELIRDSGVLGIMVSTADGRIVEANAAFLAMLGYDERALEGGALSWRTLTPPEWSAHSDAALADLQTRRAIVHEKEYFHRDGRRVPVLLASVAIAAPAGEGRRFLNLTLDLTSRRGLEAQLRQAQKMEAIGNLAGGIAHDFNNLLTVILAYGEDLAASAPAGSTAREDLEIVVSAAQRAASLTQQLLAFSRRQVLAPRVLDLRETIADVERLVRRLIGTHITFAVRVEPEVAPVYADPTQIAQVVLNLVVNARDAMPDGGQLALVLDDVTLAADAAARIEGGRPGRYARLIVEDTGVGIAPQVRARVFEPFFTTKGERGTGLGLSTVLGIVQQSAGFLALASEVGRGSRFEVYLPVTDETRRAEAARVADVGSASHERILLVEDDVAVLELLRATLARAGYRVVACASPREALHRIAMPREDEPFELLVTDAVMPGTSGRALADQVAVQRPGIAILYVSGFTEDPEIQHQVETGRAHFLAKPLTSAQLLAKVREALASARVS